ncbi:45031_t:CDS:2 [Gigaspora margarita]|uniref:45031_t:CDS:1 n=1 Tax=Gigaspora margarita TaxID=4874 RepID=A0ABN7V2Z2_GIGMA|nr:45031_t:CDS:2 [Gigaspora margarita]
MPLQRRDFNSRDLNINILGGDGLYNKADGIGIAMMMNSKMKPIFIIYHGNQHHLNDDAKQYKELIIINSGPISSHYSHICKSGFVTHFTCSYVLGLEGIFYGIGETDQTAQLIITDMYGLLGDASGPVYSFASMENFYSVDIHDTIVTAGPGKCTAQSLDTILNVIRCRPGLIFKDIIIYVKGS